MALMPPGTVHALHGARFASYVAPSTGSTQLCAWRLTLPAGFAGGPPHTVSHEEVLLVLAGTPRSVVDGAPAALAPGDVLLVPVGARFELGNPGEQEAALWVTTSVGLRGRLLDGSTIVPPWTR